MKQDIFEHELEKLISREKLRESNPFAHTRILNYLDEHLNTPAKERIPMWVRVLQPALISIALAAGILIGSYTARMDLPSQTADNLNINQVKSDLFIADITMEEQVLTFKEKP